MRHLQHRAVGTLCFLALWTPPFALAAVLPGMGQIAGTVSAAPSSAGATVYALNAKKNVGYMVYVVSGRFRATNVFPGEYEVTLRKPGLLAPVAKVTVEAGKTALTDFAAQAVAVEPDYVGGMTYPGAKIEPYDVIYPPGPGRDILERTCMGCHTIQVFPFNVVRTYPTGRTPKDRNGWAITVDRMHKSPAFGMTGKASYFDPALLTAADRDVLVDYLAANFPADAPPRVVRKEEGGDPPLDEHALEKAMIVEYRFPNTPQMPERFTQQIDFDGKGNVWVTDRGAPALVKVDPRSGKRIDYLGHGGGHGLAVDSDGTVWYSDEIVRRFDPATDLHDDYVVEGERRLGSNTQVFDSKGNLWMSLLAAGGLGLWERKSDTFSYWDVPIERSRPYGIIVDHNDKVWFAEYHNSGVASFDPQTKTFRHYPFTTAQPTNNRRPGVDSKNRIWIATWGSKGMQNGALYRVDPASGAVMERKIGIPFANPYSVEADEFDNIWVATDNYLLRYDQKADSFTPFPLAERTDVPKVTIAHGGAVWFTPRNAGQSGSYGGAAAVLYPDKDRIESFGAYFAPNSAANRLASYRGPASPKVKGVIKSYPRGAQNSATPAVAKGPQVKGKTKRADAGERRLE